MAPTFQLKLNAGIELQLAFEPTMLNLGALAKGAKVTEKVMLVGKLAPRAKITEWSTEKPEWVDAEPIQVNGASGLKVSIRAPEKMGFFSVNITAQTNLDKFKSVNLVIHGQIEADLVPSKKMVLFREEMANHKAAYIRRILSALSTPLLQPDAMTTIRVSSMTNTSFLINKVEETSGTLLGFARPDSNGTDWIVYLKQVGKPKSYLGNLNLHTDRAEQPIITIRFRAWTDEWQPLEPGGPSRRKPVAIRNKANTANRDTDRK